MTCGREDLGGVEWEGLGGLRQRGPRGSGVGGAGWLWACCACVVGEHTAGDSSGRTCQRHR